MQTLEELAGSDLSGHHGVADSKLLQSLEHLAELAYLDAESVVFWKSVVEAVFGFPFKSDEAQRDSGRSGTFRKKDRITALARDERERCVAVVVCWKEATQRDTESRSWWDYLLMWLQG